MSRPSHRIAEMDRARSRLGKDRCAGRCARRRRRSLPIMPPGWPAALWDLIEKSGTTRGRYPPNLAANPARARSWCSDTPSSPTGSLTAVFILSQHDAGVRRLVEARTNPTAAHWLAEIGAGRAFVTVGISHLTTSRRLGATAVETGARFVPDRWCHSLGHGGLACPGPCHRRVLSDGRKLLVGLADGPSRCHRPPASGAGSAPGLMHKRSCARRSRDPRLRRACRPRPRRDVTAGRGRNRRPGNLRPRARPGARGPRRARETPADASRARRTARGLMRKLADALEPAHGPGAGRTRRSFVRADPQQRQYPGAPIDPSLFGRHEGNRVLDQPSPLSAGPGKPCSSSSGRAPPRSRTPQSATWSVCATCDSTPWKAASEGDEPCDRLSSRPLWRFSSPRAPGRHAAPSR